MRTPTHAGRSRPFKTLVTLAICACWHLAQAQEQAHPVTVDTSALPPLGEPWRSTNPYRGLPEAAATGRVVYDQACARCHGAEGTGMGSAPDLRRLDGYCRRIQTEPLRSTCLADVDDYFKRTVLQGKVRVGIVHMPAWQPYLSQEAIWALRSFVETRTR